MDERTGVYAVYYLYRSRYSFVADHFLKDGHHIVSFSNLKNALKFTSERGARQFIADDLDRSSSYFATELTMEELLRDCPDLYEIRQCIQETARKGGAA